MTDHDLRNRGVEAAPSKFTKRPVTIEAIQWTGVNATELIAWISGRRGYAHQDGPSLLIETLEGTHEASLGDWIVKGVKGEFYPCKPDIFETTYIDTALAKILAKMGGVRVKPLEWEVKSERTQWARARHVAGRYIIEDRLHGPHYDLWSGFNATSAQRFDTLEAAKAAANEHHRDRILAAIEPAPSVREAARVARSVSDLMKRLRSAPLCSRCGEYPGGDIAQIMGIAAARIEALEARVAAADKLAAWARAISERKASPTTGGRLILERDIVGLDTALDAYEATKEQSDG